MLLYALLLPTAPLVRPHSKCSVATCGCCLQWWVGWPLAAVAHSPQLGLCLWIFSPRLAFGSLELQKSYQLGIDALICILMVCFCQLQGFFPWKSLFWGWLLSLYLRALGSGFCCPSRAESRVPAGQGLVDTCYGGSEWEPRVAWWGTWRWGCLHPAPPSFAQCSAAASQLLFPAF